MSSGRKSADETVVRFFTMGAVATMLEVSPRSVSRWIRSKLLIAHRFNGSVRISEAELRDFIDKHRAH